MADERTVSVPRDVGGEVVVGGVTVADADEFVLEGLKLLGVAEFVGLGEVSFKGVLSGLDGEMRTYHFVMLWWMIRPSC